VFAALWIKRKCAEWCNLAETVFPGIRQGKQQQGKELIFMSILKAIVEKLYGIKFGSPVFNKGFRAGLTQGYIFISIHSAIIGFLVKFW
jgi:hypothetical protein